MIKKTMYWLLVLTIGIGCCAYAQSANLFHGQDGYVECIAACNGRLYAMWGDGLYAYDPDEKEEVLVQGQLDRNTYLLSGGQVLYGFHPEGGL